ncbi:hypothetical protein SAMN05192545_0993 [Maribacter dokdonensis]|uniref:Apea-like HEPN domain-containing protein n=1 Tax=Maribacter dokdonensis TaxID=320912 RepID=A0ABY0U804_9FLAO|nr:hypothetical protein [Maribacter dokdonensis]SDS21956.1 hypothetical protein SAMN05192545_0993 [Maribacter dokdonensis]
MIRKHWTEPNGVFIVSIPVDWQYRNAVLNNIEEKSPYSFEAYDNSIGCFQLSCYPLSERRINPNFPVQKSNSKVEWLESRMDDSKFDMYLWHAQIDDHLCMAKCIYSATDQNHTAVEDLIKQSRESLDTFRLIPLEDRNHAINLNKYDNFIGSLASSYDLRERAMESKSYIEIIAIVSNQIDAFLRMSILLKKQLLENSNEIEIKYLFQGDNERGIIERRIYKEAKDLEIVDQETFEELNDLYDLRNRVIHRYIISHLKTVDIADISVKYFFLSERINAVLKEIEDIQIEQGIGIYGNGYTKDYEPTENDQKIAFSMVNDKHLMKEFKRKIK